MKTLMIKKMMSLAGVLSILSIHTISEAAISKFPFNVNFGGPAITIDGETFLSHTDAIAQGLTFESSYNKARTYLTPTPSVSSQEKSMFNTAIWKDGKTISMYVPLENGEYEASFYVMENYKTNWRSFNINIEGAMQGYNLGTLSKGEWEKYGPYKVVLNDGRFNIDLVRVKDSPHIMGMTINKIRDERLTALKINLGGPSITIDDQKWQGYKDAIEKSGLKFKTSYRTALTKVPTSPATSIEINSMFNSAVWNDGKQLGFTLPVSNGDYKVELYVMENYRSYWRAFDIRLENSVKEIQAGSLPKGNWMAYGPYTVTVSNDLLDIDLISTKEAPHLMGLSVERIDAPTTPDEPVFPGDPTSPVEPEVPTDPVDPTPEVPTDPVDPTPEEPTDPVYPAPEEPTDPVDPTPEEPTDPVEPTPEEPERPQYKRYINIGGGELDIAGIKWMSHDNALKDGLAFTTSYNIARTSITPVPAVDSQLKSLLNSAVWVDGKVLKFNQQLTNGEYAVKIHVVENYKSYWRKFDIKLEGALQQAGTGYLEKSKWQIYGPYYVDVSDGQLDFELSPTKDSPHLMGISLESVSLDTTPPPTEPETGGPLEPEPEPDEPEQPVEPEKPVDPEQPVDPTDPDPSTPPEIPEDSIVDLLEAEEALLKGAVFDDTAEGFSGSGYASFFEPSGESIIFSYTAPQPGKYMALWLYSQPIDSAALELHINGDKQTILGLEETGDASAWDVTNIITVTLVEGENSIELRSIGQGTPNIDSMLITKSDDEQVNGKPYGIPTFHSIGLYWKTPSGNKDNRCDVKYREVGTANWKQGHDLWYDYINHPDHIYMPVVNKLEYRGSIVKLKSNTAYEVKLTLKSGETETIVVKTWDEDFKIKKTRKISSSSGTVVITEGGNPEDGYVFYDGSDAVISGGSNNLEIRANYVIVHGLTVKNATSNGIWIQPEGHNIVIQYCDISKWGSNKPNSQFGINVQGGIYHVSNGWYGDTGWFSYKAGRFIIQYNKIHHPNTDSNSWAEAGHPEGPQAVVIQNAMLGNHVIRYNEIYSDEEHCFNDGIGCLTGNTSFSGFLVRDSDVYGNSISNSWDDGMEIEGAGMNIRVYENYFDYVNYSIAAATTAQGPLYIFRNISNHTRSNPYGSRGWGFLKLGQNQWDKIDYLKGVIYVYHNTILQPDGHGPSNGLNITSSVYQQYHLHSRNNILFIPKGTAISHQNRLPYHNIDYDLIPAEGTAPYQPNRITAEPDFAPSEDPTAPYKMGLKPGTPGHDQGVIIPNFNDNYKGKAPDIGAVESSR